MKRLLAIIMTMLAVPTIASATDFTDTDQVYGWNGTAQIWQTWADHKTQLGLLFYTESEIDILLAAKADKTNISFVAASLTDLKILTAAQPVNGEAIISDTITPGDADDDKRVATVERNAELYQPLGSANFQTMAPHTFAQIRADLDLEADTDFAAYGKNPVVVASKAADYTIGTDSASELFGGTVYVTAAATVTAAAIAVGHNYCAVTIGDIAVSLDVNASDNMILDGVTLEDGDKATNTSKSGDTICCQYRSADGLYCWSGTVLGGHWTDGN